jgi:putative transposase
LRPIYTAPTVEAAECELLAFAESELGRRYPAAVATWENAWERFIPFLAFPPEVRKIIYTTNSIESLNYQLRKIIKNRGHFPTDDAVIKLLWLAIRDIEDKRARQRANEKGVLRDHRKAPNRLVEGASIQGWKQALGALALAYPDRLAPYLGWTNGVTTYTEILTGSVVTKLVDRLAQAAWNTVSSTPTVSTSASRAGSSTRG